LQISQKSLDKPSHFGKICGPFQFPLQISEDLHFLLLQDLQEDFEEMNGFSLPSNVFFLFFFLLVRFRATLC